MTQRAQFVDLSLAKPGEKILTRDGKVGEFVQKTDAQHWPYEVWFDGIAGWIEYDRQGFPSSWTAGALGLVIVQVGE